ncbi:MAG: glycosyltransferase family 4 protein [Prevotella sp.]|jgi:glycosyltransferase involved in cell wall biosynthesis|nr:glycosyltransferase family 4 protein [Prevotella sp.]
MKIAILTSGILPVPAVLGGAVENLIDFYLEYNNQHHLHDITVYSVYHPDIKKHPALQSGVNHYKYIKINGWWAKVKKNIYHLLHKEEYYHYSIEYFLHEAIKDICHQQYDVIVLENRPAYALKLKDFTNAKLVYHLHNEKLESKAPKYEEIYEAAYRILTVSNFIKSKVQAINPQDSKTKTVYNGIDLNAFSKKNQTIRNELNNDDFLLVYSGRVNREKGIMELLEAIDLLKEKPHIKLMVIGSSFFGNATNDDKFMKELKNKATPLKDRIIFTGFIPYNEIPNYLSMADVAVIPSVWDDPFPTTVLEAQAMGLPIITTCRGGIPEEVTKENAIILDTNEHFVNKLATAILDLYEHPKQRKQMAAASLERSKFFDKETYAKNFFEALDSI